MFWSDSPSKVQRKKIQKSLSNLFPQIVKKYQTLDDSPESPLYSTMAKQISNKNIQNDQKSPFFSPKYTQVEGYSKSMKNSALIKPIYGSPIIQRKNNENLFLGKDVFNAHLAYIHQNQHNSAIEKMAKKVEEFQKGKIQNIIKLNNHDSRDSETDEKEESNDSIELELSFKKQAHKTNGQQRSTKQKQSSTMVIKSQKQETNYGYINDEQEHQLLKTKQQQRRDLGVHHNVFIKTEIEEIHIFFQNLFTYFKNVLSKKNGYSVIQKLSGFTPELRDFLFKLKGTQFQFKYQKWEQIYYSFLKKEGIEQFQPNLYSNVLKNSFYKVLAFISSQLKEQTEQQIFKMINGHNDRIVQLRGQARGSIQVSDFSQLGTKMLLKNIETFNIQYGKIKTLRDIDIFEFKTLEKTSAARKSINYENNFVQ